MATDGHYGFRAIIRLMGFREDIWAQVRENLVYKLDNHGPLYEQVYGSFKRVREIIYLLSYFNDNTPYDDWMTMPDCEHLITSHYDVILYYLGVHQCLTFLPLKSDLILAAARREIAIGFVNENHFMQAILMSGHPIPTIVIF